jgi:hypothetical protein
VTLIPESPPPASALSASAAAVWHHCEVAGASLMEDLAIQADAGSQVPSSHRGPKDS